jgi:DNA-binding transcriptional LysR family regulator
MELRELAAFVAVAEEGGMSAASRRLHISQPALRRMAEFTTEGGGVLRLGVPIELPSDLLQRTLAEFAANRPNTRVMPRHLSTAAQLSVLRSGELDIGLAGSGPSARNSTRCWCYGRTSAYYSPPSSPPDWSALKACDSTR